ncbi:hypothetical protein EWM64_g3566 [Hericium alpestre]|uniref:Glucose-methanol-choline oxidoreductase N-terminal domain-containing protein n=1 Tax=Hericium alpestre TaxID=135208 RepID=A0A4Z0A2B1_9AGAM|nr:hypothetical protein EWM64_g3566 [Hericium alpestre]
MVSTQFSPQNFDYIVVGAGTAGAALAMCLSEDPNITVGLIEAGEHVTDMMSIFVPGKSSGGPWPGHARGVPGRSKHSIFVFWFPQTHAHDQKIFEPCGKLVGSSSALNYMAWGRASKAEYDTLEALGNPGRNWEQFLLYLIKDSPHQRLC